MSTLKKLAVLSILIVTLVALSLPASAGNGVTTAGANNIVAPADAVTPAAADAIAPVAAPVDAAALSAAAPVAGAASGLAAIPNTVLPGGAIAGTAIGGTGGFGPFGGIGFPFNLGYNQFGAGAYPFNWGCGGCRGPMGMCFNQFTPCFGGGCGGFFSPCFLGGCGVCQAVPFITGCGLGGVPGPGWMLEPWAFGLGGCQQAAPLYFGAHGFGFPFTIGNIGWSLVPPLCQAVPFITGCGLGGVPGPGWMLEPWAFGLGGCQQAAPLYFGAHGFGFPFSIGCIGWSLVPPIC